MDNKKEVFDPIYLFHIGTNYNLYETMSPHKTKLNGKMGYIFRTFAPNARSVSVVGEFNDWDRTKNPMEKISEGGVYEGFVENLKIYDIYKFSIETKDGEFIFKADPMALHAETPPNTASKIFDVDNYKWGDSDWIKKRKNTNHYNSPMNIYELHLGSWKKHADGNPYSYRQLANELVSYVSSMNYTHIEIMPVTEYPYDGSWGYQVSGMFAPTSRYGSPNDFQYFVDKCHKKNIGVIVDWVGAHFPKDAFGLYKYDGDCVYEYEDEFKREHKEWGTVVFNYDKSEVRSFLISSAMFFIEKYHIDGLRVDAVASMLYLDYSRKEGEWRKNHLGTNINLEAVAFLKELNKVVLSNADGVLMMAEESTSFPMVTMPPFDGGLGFNFKWNMGWMNDTLIYASMDPYFRQYNHDKLTFSVTYAFSENYILPFSHDEVVHGKASMISKMPGYYEDKFKALKTLMAYQISFPGKKLSFMGNEFAQFIEWKYDDGLDWFLLEYETHMQHQTFIKDLNKYYLSNKEMFEQDTNIKGFEWVVVDDNTQNIAVYKRIAEDGSYTLCILNFAPIEKTNYNIGVDTQGSYKVILNSNDSKYGGSDGNKIKYKAKKGDWHGKKYFISINVPSNSVLFIKK